MMNFLEAARLFSDCWYLYKRYYGRDMEEELCLVLMDETRALHEKYGKQPFAREMILAVIIELERNYKVKGRRIKEGQ